VKAKRMMTVTAKEGDTSELEKIKISFIFLNLEEKIIKIGLK
jgi:hypothetical protein